MSRTRVVTLTAIARAAAGDGRLDMFDVVPGIGVLMTHSLSLASLNNYWFFIENVVHQSTL